MRPDEDEYGKYGNARRLSEEPTTSDNFHDGRRAGKPPFTTLGEYKAWREANPVSDEEGKVQSLSQQILICKRTRKEGEPSNRLLSHWVNLAERLQRDVYELTKHLRNGEALWSQGYKLEFSNHPSGARVGRWVKAAVAENAALKPPELDYMR